MNKTIELKNGKVEVLECENFIYFKHVGDYTDDDVMQVARYTEQYYVIKGKAVPRVYDGTHIDKFLLTEQGTSRFKQWADTFKEKLPGTSVYLIAVGAVAFGMSRMFQIKVSDERMCIHVLRSVDELPVEMKQCLSEQK